MKGETEFLRVRKQNVAVELTLTGMRPRMVEIFLPEQPNSEDRRQQVLNLLEKGTGFLPARDMTTGTWEVFSRQAVVWVRIPLETLGSVGETEELFDIRQRICIDLASGEPISGELLWSAQQESTRVTDYMNVEEHFFRLWQENHVLLVNKSCVLRLIEDC